MKIIFAACEYASYTIEKYDENLLRKSAADLARALESAINDAAITMK
ncbi:hypothetical protein [Roseibium sp. MMSF_3412]|nr:hypothetical protein [Roseibium sp. MMSF_3412]